MRSWALNWKNFMSNSTALQAITLGGGCFWCTEAVYLHVRGIIAVESGYCNGQTINPSYEQVCTGRTGHNEVVKITFDPAVITLDQIFQIFFVVHDPSTLNRQGNDAGTQYRSGIYVNSSAQETEATAFIAKLLSDKVFSQITTEVAFVDNYSRAEGYHQNYFANNPNQGYCAFVVGPKVEKFRKTFSQLSLT
jgi:peptide-methionine (S)-S-oxide reductase